MKTSKTLFKTLILVFALSFIWACSDDDSDPVVAADPDIVDLALDTDDLSILVEALQAANLVTTLQGDGPFTVFAPTNAAFQAFLT
ncbi:MAG: fasciclin domain-containing protein, partial [Eudoraea sp.]|nr:fasciclin domain-containing protein [Eudoraea sp.]